MKIKVAFTKEKNPDFISASIMKFLGTDYSHVFFIHDGVIFHSVGQGVKREYLSNYLKTHDITDVFEVDLDLTYKEFESYMYGAEGKEYSESQYIGFILPFMKKFVRNGKEKTICSELVSEVLEKFGGFKLPNEADFMSPKDVYDMLGKKK